MKRIIPWMLIVLGAVAYAPSDGHETPSVDMFDWLDGDWIRLTDRGTAAESWTRVSLNTLEGVATVTSEGADRVTEHLRILQLGDGVFYTAKPVENAFPTSFKLVEFDDERFVFENPDYDFPRRITYSRTEPDSLVTTVEGILDGEKRRIDFEFKRID